MIPNENGNYESLDLKEFLLNENFCSSKEKQSAMHLQATQRQREMIGKSHSSIGSYVPPPQDTPLETCAIKSLPRSFINLMRSIICWTSPRLEDLPFRFDCSDSSLNFKNKVIESFGYDANKIIKSSSSTMLKPGSEFRDPCALDTLL